MNGCVYAHIGDDGAVLCDRYSDFGRGIISYCDDICLDKHPSNADRIRSLSDEELAEFFHDMIQDCGCNNVPCQQFCTVSNCELAWLNWLKKEARTND